MDEVKISVIMPVYNVAPYLRTAIDSVLMQTLKEIELICVDDASTDSSADILREYEGKDSRVHTIYLSKNSGSSAVRKRAVQEAKGQYIMMLDSDDSFEPDACETVWREMKRSPVDILCFATKVTACGDIPDKDAVALTKQLSPYKGPIEADLPIACFKKKLLTQTLWNKAYKTSLCKKAFDYVKDTYRNISDDLYASFIILYFAQNYRGISNSLHRYYLGRGVSGHYSLTKKRFFSFSETYSIYDDLEEFLDSQSAKRGLYSLLDEMRGRTLEDVVYKWRYTVSVKDAPECYQKMIADWGAEKVVSHLAKNYWHDWPQLQRRIAPAIPQIHTGKPVKTIGAFYYRISNGGIERVLSIVIPLWMRAGYKVVLITEEPPEANDYALPKDLIRVILPGHVENKQERYQNRMAAWKHFVEYYEIDTIVYNAWCDPMLFWDACTIKGLNTNLIAWVHGSFAHLFRFHDVYRYELIRNYFLVDRAVTLSHIFQAFFSNFCQSYYIPNPITLCDKEDCSRVEGHNIVWVGRMDQEKHPEDAIRVLSHVVKEIPDATLTMVGGGENEELIEKIKKLAEKLHLQNQVEFVGFVKDPTRYYRRGSLLLSTSSHEGFGMTLMEAKSYGLPISMYELNYLETIRDGRGVVSAPFGDVFALSEEVCKILNDSELRQKMSKEARQSAEEMAAFDLCAAWKEVFDSFASAPQEVPAETMESSKMMQLLLNEAQIGDQLPGGTVATTVPLTEEEDRLLKSKFRKIARVYWYWKDLILRYIRKR